MANKSIYLVFLCLSQSFAAEALTCDGVDEEVSRHQELIPGHISGREVVGEGRVYFYTSPNEACIQKNVFVILGDKLDAYAVYGDFTSVIFFNFKKDRAIDGWVKSVRLKPTGTGIGPNYDALKK